MPVFDQGYQHWQGSLHGRVWRWVAIARQGTRVQGRNRVLRLLLLLAWLPSLVLVGAVAVWGLVEQKSETVLALARNLFPADVLLEPRAFRSAVWTLAYSFFFKVEMYYIMLLVAVAGPGLISRDLRFNALPLYFARPLTRLDYFLGKLGVIGALVASVAVGPAVLAYVVGVCFSLDLSVIRDTYPLLLASVAYGLVVTLSVGTLMLALSSLTRRSLYVGIAWAALWIISASVGSILTEIHREAARSASRNTFYETEVSRSDWRPLCSYVANLDRIAHHLFGTDAAWVTIGAAAERSRTVFGGRPSTGDRAAQPAERRLADRMVPQYPWVWSAWVLAGLLGLSTWILTFRVKSLDRLR